MAEALVLDSLVPVDALVPIDAGGLTHLVFWFDGRRFAVCEVDFRGNMITPRYSFPPVRVTTDVVTCLVCTLNQTRCGPWNIS